MMRHEARRIAFSLIFSSFYLEDEFVSSVDDQIELFYSIFGNRKDKETQLGFVLPFSEQRNNKSQIQKYVKHLVAGVIAERKILDEKIENAGANWSLIRIGRVERAILRMAIFEFTHPEEDGVILPIEIVIDEAVELAKIYGGEESPKFVNGVLDAIYQKNMSEVVLEDKDKKNPGGCA